MNLELRKKSLGEISQYFMTSPSICNLVRGKSGKRRFMCFSHNSPIGSFAMGKGAM